MAQINLSVKNFPRTEAHGVSQETPPRRARDGQARRAGTPKGHCVHRQDGELKRPSMFPGVPNKLTSTN